MKGIARTALVVVAALAVTAGVVVGGIAGGLAIKGWVAPANQRIERDTIHASQAYTDATTEQLMMLVQDVRKLEATPPSPARSAQITADLDRIALEAPKIDRSQVPGPVESLMTEYGRSL